jgi:Domain of unknown function (DUF1772)
MHSAFAEILFLLLLKIKIMIEICYAMSAGILGIFTGAQIAEAVLFVPYWKSLEPQKFFLLHKTYSPKIYKFFAPLTITATLIPIGTAIYSQIINSPGKIFSALMGVFTLLFFATYFIYFKKANKSFEDAALTDDELPIELDKWEKWHRARIYLEIGALICSLIAIVKI